MIQPKKLIEVAMPIKEISAESVRDKSIRHGHISTLHLWWARRPLPVCRAVVFASLVPDPLDKNCPQAFKDAVEILLGKENNLGDPYAAYADIPWTSVYDPMEDNLRNRLQMFIGKFTDDMQQYLLGNAKKTETKKMLANSSLIKWESKHDENIIGKARKLIWVAHNSKENSKVTAKELITDFDKHFKSIKDTESQLYVLKNRHLKTKTAAALETNLEVAKEAFLEKMPKVFDPFAGGGAIPLEAARLGCRSYGNDINPVAHIIQKGSLEFPQKYGKPITYSKEEFINLYGEKELLSWCQLNGLHIDSPVLKIEISNRLSYDVDFYARKLLTETEKEVGHFYPADENGNKPIAYYWVRIGTCSNPTCKAQIPLLRQFYLSKRRGTKTNDWVHFKPKISGKLIELEIAHGKNDEEGWLDRANLKCPICGSITEAKKVKQQFLNNQNTEILAAVIENRNEGKLYRKPTEKELKIVSGLSKIREIAPSEKMPENDSQNVKIPLWGFTKWADMFSSRQLSFQIGIINQLKELENNIFFVDKEYHKALLTYLSIFVDRISVRNNTFCRWHVQQDTIEHPFSRQAIPMMFDYPEMNPFEDFSGGAIGQLKSITAVIESH